MPSDELITPQIATNILLDVHDTSTRLIADAGAIVAPTLLLSSGADYVVESKPQQQFFDRLGSACQREGGLSAVLPLHVLGEGTRPTDRAEAREFIERQFEDPALAASLLEADKSGYSKSICDDLEQPLSMLSPKRWAYALQKMGMNTGGRLSRGVRIGWRTGFDSGESLDHVYRNRAEGTRSLGG